MRPLFKFMAVSALGVAAMYYLNPETGRRRRALVRDKLTSLSHDARNQIRRNSRVAADRAKGVAQSTGVQLSGQPHAQSNEQLRDRIRSELGRLVSDPGAIEVVVHEGHVSLRGEV